MTLRPSRTALAAALALAAAVVSTAAAEARPPAASRGPTVVELFTAQGCTACPQANALLQELAGRKGVLALTYPVDIWDYLGWPDTGARTEFTARQRAYIARMRLREIYTPEIVVGGRRETVGFDRTDVQALLASAGRPRGPRVRFRSGVGAEVGEGARPPGGAEVWMVRFDPQERTVKVTKGENRGKTVVQQNLVRELVRLGAWSGRAKRLTLPPPSAPGLATALLVQGAGGGPVLAAAVR